MAFSVVRVLIFGLHAVAANASEDDVRDIRRGDGPSNSQCPSFVRLNMVGDFDFREFPFIHWLWQHSIFRFEAEKLASGTIAARDLAAAWEAHHTNGIAAHTQYEHEMLFPAVKLLRGGEGAIARLERDEKIHTASAKEIEQALRGGKGDAQALIQKWAHARVTHATTEEDLIVSLVRSQMPADAIALLGKKSKDFFKEVPGSKKWLCLFRDLSYANPVIDEQYADSFPWFLRWVLIPSFSATDEQYKEHKRIFGSIAR